MRPPTGSQIILLTRGPAIQAVEPGTQLDNGYVVESVHDGYVRVSYPPSGVTVDLPIPPPPIVAQ